MKRGASMVSKFTTSKFTTSSNLSKFVTTTKVDQSLEELETGGFIGLQKYLKEDHEIISNYDCDRDLEYEIENGGNWVLRRWMEME